MEKLKIGRNVAATPPSADKDNAPAHPMTNKASAYQKTKISQLSADCGLFIFSFIYEYTIHIHFEYFIFFFNIFIYLLFFKFYTFYTLNRVYKVCYEDCNTQNETSDTKIYKISA